jgi:hypothetical protein
MSFVPAPQKASTAGTANANNTVNGSTNAVNNVPSAAGEAAEKAAGAAAGEEDAFITSRTFDAYWVDKTALMYRDGFVKVRSINFFVDRGVYGGICESGDLYDVLNSKSMTRNNSHVVLTLFTNNSLRPMTVSSARQPSP